MATDLPFEWLGARLAARQGEAGGGDSAQGQGGVRLGEAEGAAAGGIIYTMSPHNVANVGSDGTPCPPVFTVDETTPHALVIVPVPAGAGGRVIQQIDPEQPWMGRRTRGTF
jgi:hypothetical protein